MPCHESLYSCHSTCFITRQTEMHRLSSSKLVKKYNSKRACIDPEPTIHDEPASLINHPNPAPPTYWIQLGQINLLVSIFHSTSCTAWKVGEGKTERFWKDNPTTSSITMNKFLFVISHPIILTYVIMKEKKNPFFFYRTLQSTWKAQYRWGIVIKHIKT